MGILDRHTSDMPPRRGRAKAGKGSASSEEDEVKTGRGNKSRPASYIANGVERRKFFGERIKAIRSRVETFARCTGENILVIAVDEEGRAHHWGTSAFQKFVADDRVTSIMYRYLNEPAPSIPAESAQPIKKPSITSHAQLAHVQAMVRDRMRIAGLRPGSEAPWPASVPFQEPGSLSPEDLMEVASSFIRHADATGQMLPVHNAGVNQVPHLNHQDPLRNNQANKMLRAGVIPGVPLHTTSHTTGHLKELHAAAASMPGPEQGAPVVGGPIPCWRAGADEPQQQLMQPVPVLQPSTKRPAEASPTDTCPPAKRQQIGVEQHAGSTAAAGRSAKWENEPLQLQGDEKLGDAAVGDDIGELIE